MIMGDVRCKGEMAKAVDGCEAVVHCAYGTSWGQRQEIFDVTVGGTRNLAEAARAAGLSRFVHLSTWAIHGTQISGVADEATPVRPPKDDYCQSKAKAEKCVLRAAEAGLPAVILRLTNVYGPFSSPFTIRPVQHLLQGLPVMVGSGEMPSNTVYVDNVVEAIVRSLQAPAAEVSGECFTINDGDNLSWADYHAYYARALGLEMRSLPLEELDRLRRAQASGPLRWIGSWFRAARDRGLGRDVRTGEESPGYGANRQFAQGPPRRLSLAASPHAAGFSISIAPRSTADQKRRRQFRLPWA